MFHLLFSCILLRFPVSKRWNELHQRTKALNDLLIDFKSSIDVCFRPTHPYSLLTWHAFQGPVVLLSPVGLGEGRRGCKGFAPGQAAYQYATDCSAPGPICRLSLNSPPWPSPTIEILYSIVNKDAADIGIDEFTFVVSCPITKKRVKLTLNREYSLVLKRAFVAFLPFRTVSFLCQSVTFYLLPSLSVWLSRDRTVLDANSHSLICFLHPSNDAKIANLRSAFYSTSHHPSLIPLQSIRSREIVSSFLLVW